MSYQTAYLKAHYPPEYMAAIMTIYMDNQDRLVEYINECRNIGLGVRPPDINVSEGDFTPEEDYVLFGLSAVRNVGSAVVDQIVACRDEGPEDFVRDGRSGFLVPPRDSRAIADAVESLLTPGRIESMSSAAGSARARPRSRSISRCG